MKRKNNWRPQGAQRCAIATAIALTVPVAHGFQLDTGNPDLSVRWDNTLKYSSAWRVEGQSDRLLSDINGDDGDRNFDRGLISNRMDLLSELDIVAGDFGARVSGAAWYDTAYNRSNDNDSPDTVNHLSRDYDEFPSDTRKLHGRKGELLDAFVFGRLNLAGYRTTFRAGRHAMQWGESLFFGDNGIAGGMSPIDAVKALSVPNSQFKELIRPTEQVSGQIQFTPEISLGAYYQFRWDKTRIPATGSYFETSELASDGSERFFFGPTQWAAKGKDIKARDSGQYGVQLRFQVGETDFGLYHTRYHSKTPQVYFAGLSGGVPERFFNVYAEDIKAYGASFSRTFGLVNIAGEVSVRHNMPLSSDPQLDLFGVDPSVVVRGDNDDNPLYAVGRTAHAQLSWLASMPPSFIADDASFLGEVAWNRVTSVTKNPGALNPNADRDAWSLRMVYEPKYYQVFPGIDLSVPMGIGYGVGNSSVGATFLGDHVGNLNIGVSGNYLQQWNFGITYTHFFGPEGTFAEDQHASYKQALADRDFISLSLSRTF